MLVRYSSQKGKLVKKAVVYTRQEHGIDNFSIDPDALRVITYLRSCGFEAYLVGGAVRDLLLSKKPKDFDIVTNATPQRLKRLFRNSRIIGKRFRLVHVFFGDKIFEVSTFRSVADGTVGNSFGTMDEDVRRRDFTLNALYYDPLKEQIIDYVGGVKDIKKRRIEPVIPLKNIFADDPVRMLRAVKYAALLQFHLPFLVKRKIKKTASLLIPVSPSRLTEELIKILNSGCAREIIKLALETDIFMYLQPAAAEYMDSNELFSAGYEQRLKELDAFVASEPSPRLGQKIFYLIYDFVCALTDWKKECEDTLNLGELYGKTWTACRRFVLPMNPPRAELEYAVRAVLKKLGVPVRNPKKKRARPTAEPRPPASTAVRPQAAAGQTGQTAAGQAASPI